MTSFASNTTRSAAARTLSALACGALATCSGGGQATQPTNVLIVVADDVGIDMLSAYGFHPDAPPTPTLDALMAQGVRFTHAYTPPTCSPTRAALLTGRYGFRTGIGEPLQEWLPEHALLLSEVTLPEMLSRASGGRVSSSAIGKWHLGSASIGGLDHPNLQGFEYFRGTFGNLYQGQTYFSHSTIENGVRLDSTTYCTSEQADDALARIQAMPQPWLTYLCFNAAHKPFHAPPANLHTYALSGDPDLDPHPFFCASFQALDTELGRVLDGMDPAVRANTTIIFLGDNGSPNEAVTPPSVAGASKGYLYEGGVHVPLLISGKHVASPGRTCDALVNTVDLFPTVADLMGLDLRAGVGDNRPIDGVSLFGYLADPAQAELRSWVFGDKFTPNGFGPYASESWMIRDQRWKLVRRSGQPDQLFDLQGLFLEGPDLLLGALTPEQQSAYDALAAQLTVLLASG